MVQKVERAVSSPYFQWVVIAAGIGVYAGLNYFSGSNGSVPDEILETPTPAFISVALVLLFWALKLLLMQTLAALTQSKPPRDIVYKDLSYFWVYGQDGSIQGGCVYELENRSDLPIEKLPYEALVWFKSIEKKDVKFRIIYRDGDIQHRFEAAESEWNPLPGFVEILRGRAALDLSWSPQILPPVAPGETILYEVEIATPKTERDAFKSEGTILGFPVRRYTNRVSLTARAPRGHRFRLLNPATNVLVIDTGQNEPILEAGVMPPSISTDGSLLTWEMDFPSVGYRYWANFRFDRKS